MHSFSLVHSLLAILYTDSTRPLVKVFVIGQHKLFGVLPLSLHTHVNALLMVIEILSNLLTVPSLNGRKLKA